MEYWLTPNGVCGVQQFFENRLRVTYIMLTVSFSSSVSGWTSSPSIFAAFLGVSVSLSSWSYCSWLPVWVYPFSFSHSKQSVQGCVRWHFNLLWRISPPVTWYDLFFSLVWFLGLLQLIWYAFNSFLMDILGFNSLIAQTTKWLHAIWDCMRKEKSILSTVFGRFLAQTAKN